MIRPPWDGVAFSERSDGDVRNDPVRRADATAALGLAPDWAEVRQIHGNDVIRVGSPGAAGEADALWTAERGLPIAVFTADCLGVVLVSEDATGVAHAGWRGAAGGVVGRLRDEMTAAGHAPRRAAIGPGIGPCCFEVGPEVVERFPAYAARTTRDTTSVDLTAAVVADLDGVEIWSAGACTMHEDRWFSHRRDGTKQRLAAIGWVP